MKIKPYLILALILPIGLLVSCQNNDKSEIPSFLFGGPYITAPEDDPNGFTDIPVYLSLESDDPVSVDYVTVDSTAIAGRDYVPITSGNLTFQPGELAKVIRINLIPDTTVKKDVYLKIELSNPVNGRLSKSSIRIKIINVDFASLVWSDEFDLSGLNTSVWNYERGSGGWGNNELQNYTDLTVNVHLDTGYLHISALNPSGTSYTSGRINTHGKKQFAYGRIDIRAKMPEGKGLWPALWMLGANYISIGWPKCGEIDIMELLGHEPAVAHGAVHWDSNGHTSRTNSFTLGSGKFSSGFHVFSIIWTPNNLIWKVDKQQFFHLTRAEIPAFPFDLPQFIICNVAVGGNWPGSPDQTTVFPQHLIVDYIRVYQ